MKNNEGRIIYPYYTKCEKCGCDKLTENSYSCGPIDTDVEGRDGEIHGVEAMEEILELHCTECSHVYVTSIGISVIRYRT